MKTAVSHVLHVDDDPSDILLLEQACRRGGVGFQLHSVTDGETALAYLDGTEAYANREQHPLPSLVLLDLKMPRKSGFDVIIWMRKHKSVQHLPVVILTASNQDQDIKRAYEVGANSYLVKPVGIHTLIDLVKLIEEYWLRANQLPEMPV